MFENEKISMIVFFMFIVLSLFVSADADDMACADFRREFTIRAEGGTEKISVLQCFQGMWAALRYETEHNSDIIPESIDIEVGRSCIFLGEELGGHKTGRCDAPVPAGMQCCNYSSTMVTANYYFFVPEEMSCNSFITGSATCDAPVCYTDDDCHSEDSFMVCEENDELGQSPTCIEAETCTRDWECGTDKICEGIDGQSGKWCVSVVDMDGDGIPGTVAPSGLPVSEEHGPDWDCDDNSNLCTDVCYDSECESEPGCSGGVRDFLPDCRDYCVDADADDACDSYTSKKVVSSVVFDALPEEKQAVMDEIGFDHSTYEDILDIYDDTYQGNVVYLFDNESNTPDFLYKFYNDCNDNDPSITPFNDEDNSVNAGGDLFASCNFIDDDCDMQVDECSNYTTGGGTITDIPRSCVYTGSFKGCQRWDADDDGYFNASFGCPLCTDCDDYNNFVNPGHADCKDGDFCDDMDNNCNGLPDEMRDDDGDNVYDYFEPTAPVNCRLQGSDTVGAVTPVVDNYGCWISYGHEDLDGWRSG